MWSTSLPYRITERVARPRPTFFCLTPTSPSATLKTAVVREKATLFPVHMLISSELVPAGVIPGPVFIGSDRPPCPSFCGPAGARGFLPRLPGWNFRQAAPTIPPGSVSGAGRGLEWQTRLERFEFRMEVTQ